MSTRLDRLLESIDPSRTLDKVSTDVDRAINTFTMGRATIEKWDEYEKFLADFSQHIERAVLKMGHGAPNYHDLYWSRCSDILNKEFGPSGFKVAFEMVRTGKDGGLYRILKTIADQMAMDYAQNEISARVDDYWSQLSIDEQLAATDEYLKKYEHLLPSEFKGENAPLLKMHFPEVLKGHPKVIRSTRRIGR